MIQPVKVNLRVSENVVDTRKLKKYISEGKFLVNSNSVVMYHRRDNMIIGTFQRNVADAVKQRYVSQADMLVDNQISIFGYALTREALQIFKEFSRKVCAEATAAYNGHFTEEDPISFTVEVRAIPS